MYHDPKIVDKGYDTRMLNAFIGRLKDLQIEKSVEIPDWQMRKADYIAPGETIFLSDWEDINLNDTVWQGNTVYFKSTLTIPPEFEGERIYVDLDPMGECILFINGKIVQGLDVHRSVVLLSEKAKQGEAFELCIEAAPRWQTFAHLRQMRQEIPVLRFVKAKLITINEEIRSFTTDIEQIARISLESEYKEAVTTDIFKTALLIIKLDSGIRDEILSQIRKVREKIEAYKVSKSGFTVSAVSHSHMDVAYLWPVKETVRKCARTFSNMLRLMDVDPDFKYTQSQPLLYKYTKEYYPEIYEQIKVRVKEGRWEIIGGMWCEPDGTLPSGEAFVRQLLYGNRFIKKEFGIDTNICFMPDTFGFTGALPQILKKSGVDYFHSFKLVTSRYNDFPYRVFFWEGIDGTKILSEVNQFGSYEGKMELSQINKGVKRCKEKNSDINDGLYLYGFGDGGGGATRKMVEDAKWLNTYQGAPKVEFSTMVEYLEKIEAQTDNLPTWYGDLYLEWHQGCYTSQGLIKLYNRKCENEYRSLEIMNVWAEGRTDLEKIKHGWELILVNQFHDILPGSSIRETFENSYKEYDEALEISASLQVEYLNKIAGAGEGIITIFNPLSFERSELIEIEADNVGIIDMTEGRQIETVSENGITKFFAENIPSIGYKKYKLTEKASITASGNLAKEDKEQFIIENDLFILEISKITGDLTRLYHKKADREGLCEKGTGLVLYNEIFDFGDAWNIARISLDNGVRVDGFLSAELVENTAFTAKVKVLRSFNRSRLCQIISVTKTGPRIDFITEVDWQETGLMLKAEFVAPVYSSYATYDIPYGNMKLSTKDSTAWDIAKYEMCAHKWVDLSEPNFGVSVLSDCKYGYVIKNNKLTVTLLKSPRYPDDTCDIGLHKFTYSFMAHEGGFNSGGTDKEGYKLNIKPVVISGGREDEGYASFAKTDADNVYIECIKFSEDSDNDIIIRAFENHGSKTKCKMTLMNSFSQCYECDMSENELSNMKSEGNDIYFEINPYEIKTVKIRV